MDQPISKSLIQGYYNDLLSEGHESWDAKAIVINSFMRNDDIPENDTPEYFFTIKTIWDLCDS
jgi:hypothetical protein